MICPFCNEELTYLNAYVFEQNKYEVNLVDDKDMLDYSCSEPLDGSATRTDFECPYCSELIHKEESEDSQPEIVIKMLGRR